MNATDARKVDMKTGGLRKDLRHGNAARITGFCHIRRRKNGGYFDVPDFCSATALAEARKNWRLLTLGPYLGTVELENDYEQVVAKMARLIALLREQRAESARLDDLINKTMERLTLA